MSKAIKEIMIRDYQERLGETDDALVVSLRGVSANDNNALRSGLASKEIRVTVVRNNLVRQAVAGSGLEALLPLLEGSSALAYGAESVVEVARELMGLAKDVANLELKGACLDGELFEGPAGVERLSKFPTRDEAIAQAVTLVLSPARNLVSQITGPGSGVAGLLKAIADKLEQGEAIEAVG